MKPNWLAVFAGFGGGALLYASVAVLIFLFGEGTHPLGIYFTFPLLLLILVVRWAQIPFDFFTVGTVISFFVFPRFLHPRLGLIAPLLVFGALTVLGWRRIRPNAISPAWQQVFFGFTVVFFQFLVFRGFYRDASFKDLHVSPRTETVLEFSTSYHNGLVLLSPADDILPDAGTRPDIEQILGFLGKAKDEKWISVYADKINQTLAPWQGETDFFYHALAQPGLVLAHKRENVVVLGGKTGLAVKEVVKHTDVKTIWNVDIDGKWIRLNRENEALKAHLRGALDDPRVQTVVADPILWLRHQSQLFDVILVEDPEPRRFPLARGFSLSFFRDLKKRLAPGGTATLSLGSFDEPDFWCVVRTAREAGLVANPSHSLDLNGYEGTLILSHEGLDLESYDERVPQFAFMKPSLMLASTALEYYQQDEVVVARSQPFPLHTLQRPGCLPYLLPSH